MNPIKAFRLYLKVKPFLKEGERVFSMKMSFNTVLQALAWAGQGANIALDVLPGKGKFYAALALGGIQALSGLLAQFYNPDGTPAVLPWQKPEVKR